MRTRLLNYAVMCLFSVSVLLMGFASSSFARIIGEEIIPEDACHEYPLKITKPGKYHLAANINLAALHCDKSAIAVAASWVTLDLGGHAIIGTVTTCPGIDGHHGIDTDVDCPEHAPPCLPGEELDTDDNTCSRPCHVGVTVLNGTVTQMGDDGVHLKNESKVEEVKAIGNCGEGIVCGEGCLIINNLSNGNEGDGYEIDDNGLATGNVASDNGGDGFKCDSTNVSLVNNTARGNSGLSNNGCKNTAGNRF